MLAIDLNNQIVFVVGAYFVNTMNVVFIKITAAAQGLTAKETKLEVERCRRHMAYFIVTFFIVEVFILTLKGIIY